MGPRRTLAGLALLSTLGAAGPAWAAACCVGATGPSYGLLGKCERLGLGLAYDVQGEVGAFGGDRSFHATEGYSRHTHRLTPTALVRPTRWFQAGVAVPLVAQRVSASGKSEAGFGLGDASAWVRFDPFEDSWGAGPSAGLPVPTLALAVGLPTGRSPDAVEGGTGAAITGTGYATLTPTLGLERTVGRGQLAAAGSVVLPLPRVEDGGATLPGIAWKAGLQGAWFTTRHLTLSLAGGARGAGPGRVEGRTAGSPSWEPWLSAGVVAGLSSTLRLAVGVEGTLPIPGLGRSREATVGAAAALTYVVTPKARNFDRGR